MARFKRPKIIPAAVILEGYCTGIFPMAMESGEIGWFSPDPRGIIPIEGFHVPHGLKRAMKKLSFELKINADFENVMRSCANRSETWISEEIIASYVNLHRLGFAHSVETWLDGKLVGGLYGVSVAGAFFGESMFHTVTDASKIALLVLVQRLRERGYRLLDAQYVTDHLKTFGAVEISRPDYLKLLRQAIVLNCQFV